jgi:hypothetical protein
MWGLEQETRMEDRPQPPKPRKPDPMSLAARMAATNRSEEEKAEIARKISIKLRGNQNRLGKRLAQKG